jgi:hypothetical protein
MWSPNLADLGSTQNPNPRAPGHVVQGTRGGGRRHAPAGAKAHVRVEVQGYRQAGGASDGYGDSLALK